MLKIIHKSSCCKPYKKKYSLQRTQVWTSLDADMKEPYKNRDMDRTKPKLQRTCAYYVARLHGSLQYDASKDRWNTLQDLVQFFVTLFRKDSKLVFAPVKQTLSEHARQ